MNKSYSNLDAQLMEACRSGDAVASRALVKMGASPTYETAFGKTPLMAACESGVMDCIQFIAGIAQHTIDCEMDSGMTALLFAIKNWNRDAIDYLVGLGACMPNNGATVNAIVAAWKKIDRADVEYLTARGLASATVARLLESLHPTVLLVENADDLFCWMDSFGIDVARKLAMVGGGLRFESFAAMKPNFETLNVALLSVCASGPSGIRNVKDLLMIASPSAIGKHFLSVVSHGHGRSQMPGIGDCTERVGRLLALGADPNAISDTGEPAIVAAARHPDLAVLELLVAAGANPSSRCAHGVSAIEVAIGTAEPLDRVRVLLSATQERLDKHALMELARIYLRTDERMLEDYAETPATRVLETNRRQLLAVVEELRQLDSRGSSDAGST
jgi:ankyrin repeat protein